MSVTLWFSLQWCCKTFCFVCFYQPALCRKCVFVLWTSSLRAKLHYITFNTMAVLWSKQAYRSGQRHIFRLRSCSKTFNLVSNQISDFTPCAHAQSRLILCISNTSVVVRGVTNGCKGGENSMGTESLWGRRWLRGAEKSQQCHKYFLQKHICFRKTSGSNMGASNLFLAPGAIVPEWTARAYARGGVRG